MLRGTRGKGPGGPWGSWRRVEAGRRRVARPGVDGDTRDSSVCLSRLVGHVASQGSRLLSKSECMVGLEGGRSAAAGDAMTSDRGNRAEPSGAKGAPQGPLAQAQSAGQLSSYCAVRAGVRTMVLVQARAETGECLISRDEASLRVKRPPRLTKASFFFFFFLEIGPEHTV
jgi:hypothetical protein